MGDYFLGVMLTGTENSHASLSWQFDTRHRARESTTRRDRRARRVATSVQHHTRHTLCRSNPRHIITREARRLTIAQIISS